MYHRVAELESDIWDLAVSPTRFEQQLRVLKKTANVISTEELIERLEKRTLKKHSIVITFDDGYVDNYLVAKPILESFELPATFFITSGNIGLAHEFWWDELAHICLFSKELPLLFSLTVASGCISISLQNEQQLSDELRQKHKVWKASDEAPPSLRATLFYLLWQHFKPLPYTEQQLLLQHIRVWAGQPVGVRPHYQSMSLEQMRELSNNPLFTIGAHTVTHPALASHSPLFQKQQLLESKQLLSQAIGRKIDMLAYPYGDYNEHTPEIAAAVEFKAAFTTEARAITAKTDLYHLGRFQVTDWQGKELQRQLKYWFSYC
jgi:peptidoglycan/xylan/chitin deacetylase (PgdA/CDA1 family)